MENANSGFSALCQRVEKLEQQNGRIRLLCSALIAAPVLALIACVSRPNSTLEAQKFVLRDKNGRVRAEIAMTYDFGPKGNPVVRLLDENGKELTTIGAGVLTISGAGENAVLLRDNLQFSKGAATARLGSGFGSDGGSLWLFGKDGTMLLNSDTPVLEVTDSNGFRADLGSNDLAAPRTGEKRTTSAATLVLADKKGNVIWRTP